MPQQANHTSHRFPLAPLAASGLVLVLAWWYLGRGSGGEVTREAGVFRVVSWNVRSQPGKTVNAPALAEVLAKLEADAIAVQGLADEEQGRQLATALGSDWQGEILAGAAGTFVAVWAAPHLEVESYHLVPTAAGDAVALTLRHPSGQTCRLVSLDAGGGAPKVPNRHVAGILTWCSTHRTAPTILAGPMAVEPELRARLTDRFIEIGDQDDRCGQLWIEPSATQVAQAVRVAQVDVAGLDCPPVLVDIVWP